MGLHFYVLGPLKARLDEVDVNLGSAKQRALLLALLLDANRIVSVDRLTGLLWDGEPPPSAVANMRTYVYRLRRALGDPGGQRLVGHPPGYLIRVDPEELDLLQYEQLVEDARTAAASGDVTAAAGTLRHALDLWRGDAAEDLRRDTSLRSRLAVLDEQRLTVVEEWIEAKLELGDHRETIGMLRRLLEQHPLRERMWHQLMVGLYRSGDAVAALAAYSEAEAILAGELALEPGPALRGCRAAVLARDPKLATISSSIGGDLSPSQPVPRELPIDIPGLVGRDTEVTLIRSVIRRDRPVIVALDGPAGVGKSALAIHSAHQVQTEYPDGQMYVDLQGATNPAAARRPAEVLAELIRALGCVVTTPAVGDYHAAAAAFRSLLAGRRMILVLDNAADEEQVRPLLPGAPGVLVLITSRRMLAGLDCALHLRIDPLGADAGAAMLAQACGPDRASAHPQDLRRIVTFCDGLPLALRIVGAQLAARPDRTLAAAADQLAEEYRRLDLLAHGGIAVRSSLTATYERLTAEARRLLWLLSQLRLQTITLPLASVVFDPPARDVERPFDELVRHHLLGPVGPAHYRMPELVRLHALEQGGSGSLGSSLRQARACPTAPTCRSSTGRQRLGGSPLSGPMCWR